MKIKNILFLIGLLILFEVISAGSAHAVTYNTTGNPGDTVAGTVITAEAGDATLDYTDINANVKPTVNPNSVEITVLPIYGFTMALLDDQNMYVNKIVSNETGITNEGNASDSITITAEATFVNTTGTWSVKLMKNPGAVELHDFTSPQESYTTTEVYAEDADILLYFEVLAPDTDGTPGAHIIITTEASTANSPVGQYTGANGLTYGGPGSTVETTTYTLYKPLLTLTRTSTVDAPNVYTASYSGADDHDAVPGSVITYTLSYNNTGNTSAASVILIDRIPTPEAALQTNIAHFNADTAARTNVTIDAGQGSAGGWTIYYSNLDDPSKAYGNTADWSGANGGTIGSLTATNQFPGNELYTTGSTEFSAKWVKWEKASVAAAENDTLTYGVTIR